jgi:uncharacterized protein VirK/YbjX
MDKTGARDRYKMQQKVICSFHVILGLLMEGEVRLRLRNEELAELAQGQILVHEISATSFLVAGLQLEDLQ